MLGVSAMKLIGKASWIESQTRVRECVIPSVWTQDSGTMTERQRKARIRGSEIARGRVREIVCFLTHQCHGELECDWKSPVYPGFLPRHIMHTGCSEIMFPCYQLLPAAFVWNAPWDGRNLGMSFPHRQAEAHTHTPTPTRCQTCDSNTHRHARCVHNST